MKTTKEPQEDGLLNKADLAKRLACSSRTIDNWMKLGFLPYIKIGFSVRFYWTDVKTALAKYKVAEHEN